MSACRFLHVTPNRPGAIAIIQLIGATDPVLRELTDQESWPIGRMRLVNFSGIDEGLAGRITGDIAQLMPHGGMRVVQRLIAKLLDLGVEPADESSLDPMEIYPESSDRYEAIMLGALARAQSPLAVNLLLDQPRRWRTHPRTGRPITEEDLARSARLNRLIDPPIVVLAGPPNVGKSTLSNALLGRSMSIAIDMPGTTRDYTTGRIELAGLVVDWHDTPGMRATDDAIESKAIEIARGLMARADFLIAITDHEHDWPELPRAADLKVANKCDLSRRKDADVNISATTGENIETLVSSVRDMLVSPEDLTHPGPWLFDERIVSS